MTDTTTDQTALPIQHTAVMRALRMLDAAGAKYAVQFDGATYGQLEVKPQRPKKKHGDYTRYPRGATRSHYLPYLETLEPGETASVPCGDFDPRTLSANISSYCVNAWGAGNAMTSRNDNTGCIDVLRFG